jgi:transcriptional regulator with PAS, ATPase and Fis domain
MYESFSSIFKRFKYNLFKQRKMSRRQEAIGMSQEPRLEQDISYLLDTTSTPVVRRRDGKVIWANEAAKQMFEGLDITDVRLRRVMVEQEQVYDRRRGIWCVVNQMPIERVDGESEIIETYRPLEERPIKTEMPYAPGYHLKRSGREIIWKSAQIYSVLENALQASSSDHHVLILGETGVGKDLIAELIHNNSDRTGGYVVVNCSTLDETMLKSELFGHEKGAFTGAYSSKKGLLEVADRGTIFLDEIGDMSQGVQAMLLRTLEYKTFRKLGGIKEISPDFRLIAATNKDLQKEIAAGRFRLDLFYRLNVLSIHIPPLRERAEDIPYLVDYLIYEKTGGRGKRIAPEVMEFFMSYSWPGNIRELSNVVERMIIMASLKGDTVITEKYLPPDIIRKAGQIQKSLKEVEKEHIERVLIDFNGNRTHTAKILGIARGTLIRKIELFGIGDNNDSRTT